MLQRSLSHIVATNFYFAIPPAPATLISSFDIPPSSVPSIREQRDAAIEGLRTKTAKSMKSMKSLQDKAEKASSKLDVQQAQSSSAKLSAAVQIGGSILSAIFGRKARRIKASTVNSASHTWKESQDVKADIAALDQQITYDTQRIRDQYDPATQALETSPPGFPRTASNGIFTINRYQATLG